jgi:two-component sensor histidine kinase/ligand-binding sensor domain-containing protein
MRNLLFILLIVFSAKGIGQISQPVLLGVADWKITNANASPEYVPAVAHKRKMTKKIYQDEVVHFVSRKFYSGTEILSNSPLRPRSGTFRSSGKKIIPTKTENAPPLLERDNQLYNVSYADRQHGFSGNATSGITEDNEHNIWMVSDRGLIKYDGYRYQTFDQKCGLIFTGTENIVFDKYNRLWIASEKGVYYVIHDSLFTINSKEFDFTNLRCKNVTIDRHQRVWICTTEKGTVCIDNTNISIYDKKSGLPINNVFKVMIDSKENIWVLSSDSGVTVLQSDKVIRMFHRTKQCELPSFFSIEEDENGIWIGGYVCGLINLTKNDTVQYSRSGRYNERIYDIKKTKGGLWLSMYGAGLYYFNKNLQYLIGDANGLQSRFPFFLYEDSYNNIWISDLANGFSRLNENSFYIQPFQNKIMDGVGEIVADHTKGNWIFTSGNGALYQKGNSITQYGFRTPDHRTILDYPMAGILAKDGTVWMGSYGDGPVMGGKDFFTNFEYSKDYESKTILSVQEDKNQHIWFATENYGLIMYDRKKFWHYDKQTGLLDDGPLKIFTDRTGMIYSGFINGMQRFTDNQIHTLYINQKKFTDQVNYFCSPESGPTLIGTQNNGILIIDKNKLFQLTEHQGIKSNRILTIIQSKDQKIWISTDKSIEYFIFEGTKIKEHKIFSQANGSFVSNNASVLLDSTGNPFWTANLPLTNKKLLFNPVFANQTYPPPYFSINQVLIDQNTWDSTKSLSILPNQTLNINYTVKYWGRENYIDIKYLLVSERGDSSLRSVDKKGNIFIGEILPGRYSIYLTANDDGRLYKTKPLYLIVRNFWYNTWWFRLTMACIAISGIILYFRKNALHQKNINRILATKVKEQTEQLRKEKDELLHSYQIIAKQSNEKGVLLQEINHRVKNNLQFMIAILDMQLRSELPEDAKSALRSTSNRMNAMSLVHGMLYDNEDFGTISIKRYLEELVGHFNSMASVPANRIAFHVTTDDISIPMKPAISLGMIISELISNSFKHAFHNIPNPEITIKITRSGVPDNLSLYYSDNGNGKPHEITPKKGLGNRLINIFSRELNGHYVIDDNKHFSFMLTFNPSKQSEKDA